MYITRNIEQTINRISNQFKVLLLTGARQVGKTTLLKHLAQSSGRTYVTLDDLAVRSLALSDPALFLQRYTPPLLIDEIQYAPQLLSYIKMYADNGAQNGDIWLTGSQRLPLMQGVTESLAGRVGIIDLQGLSANEINGTDNTEPFLPEAGVLFNRMNHDKKQSLKEIYQLIWQGSMPAMYNGSEQDWQSYYASYVQTFLQRDVMKLLQINDEMVFFRFLCAAAGQTGKMINYAELAKAAEISATTAKQWIKTLEAAGIIYLLQPFMPPGAKYIVKAPKLYFFDTGLAAYLTRWLNADALEAGAASSEFFETWVVTEIYKSYSNKGIVPPLYYLRNFNGKEIELIIWQNGTAYPIAVKKSAYPSKAVKTFAILEPVSADAKINIGAGGIVCLIDDLLPASDSLYYIPAWVL
jgi:predicted AAA+ superfamily ATPase